MKPLKKIIDSLKSVKEKDYLKNYVKELNRLNEKFKLNKIKSA